MSPGLPYYTIRRLVLLLAILNLTISCSKQDSTVTTPIIDQIIGSYACTYTQSAATSVGNFTSSGGVVVKIAQSTTNPNEIVLSYTIGSAQQNFEATLDGTVITIKKAQTNPGLVMTEYGGSGLYDSGKLTCSTYTVSKGGTVIQNDFSGKKQ